MNEEEKKDLRTISFSLDEINQAKEDSKKSYNQRKTIAMSNEEIEQIRKESIKARKSKKSEEHRGPL